MEDEILIVQDLRILSYYNIHVSLYAVFDGHGGKDCSLFLKEKYLEILKNSFQFYFNYFEEN